MRTSIVTVCVTCPKCGTGYIDRYLPERALPETNGIGHGNTDDCVVTSCPSCDHMVSAVVRITDGGEK
jgi:hypothetical protein